MEFARDADKCAQLARAAHAHNRGAAEALASEARSEAKQSEGWQGSFARR